MNNEIETEETAKEEHESEEAGKEPTAQTDPLKTYESFFGEGTEEEQIRIKEIAARLNIRDNDALWLIVYIMNYFGRFYENLPQRIQDSAAASVSKVQERCVSLADVEMERVKGEISKALLQHSDNFAKRHSANEIVLPLAWLCLGLFVLSLMMFVAGVAVTGRGWGANPLDMLLAAPAGWILPIAVTPLSGYTIYSAWNKYLNTNEKKHLVSIAGALAVVLTAVFCFVRLWTV